LTGAAARRCIELVELRGDESLLHSFFSDRRPP
jgi:hypothetical protein